jgi:ATP-binding cassette subfamily B protein/subfamily B ATP-binding cassette protein MsbA
VNVLRPYVLHQWRTLVGAAGGTVVLAAAELAKPWPIALIVDHLIAEHTALVQRVARLEAQLAESDGDGSQ